MTDSPSNSETPKSAHNSFWETSEAIDIFIILLGFALSYIIPWSFTFHPILYVPGVVFLCLAVWMIALTHMTLSKYKQPAAPGKPTTQLVQEGILLWSRNPIYLANILIYISLGFLFNSLWFIALTPIATIIFTHWMILPEEKYLAELFGNEYENYKRRVRRWL